MTKVETSDPENLSQARVPVDPLGEVDDVLVFEIVLLLGQGVLEHVVSGVFFGKRDVYSLLEPSAHGRVEAPRVVGGAEHEDLAFLVADTLHLHEELGLDSPAGLVFVVRAGRH